MARASLAKRTTSPVFGYDDEYQLPTDCLRVVEVPESRLPWVVEGRKLLSDEGAPLNIRYIRREEDPNQYDPLLFSAIAARLALEMAEELTQSNTKRELAEKEIPASPHDGAASGWAGAVRDAIRRRRLDQREVLTCAQGEPDSDGLQRGGAFPSP